MNDPRLTRAADVRVPMWARWVIAVSPRRDRRGDVESDIAELYGDRCVRYGRVYAHRRLLIDIVSLWRGSLRGGTMLRDLKFGIRLVRKHPAPVAIAIGGLALAIGAVTSVFTIVDASMLRPHGMSDPSSVVRVVVPGHGAWAYWPYVEFLRMREEATLSRLEASELTRVRLSTQAPGDEVPLRFMQFVSGGYHATFGAKPAVGRALQPSDDLPGAPVVIVVSHYLWSTEFNSDPAAVGRTVWVNGAAVTLVGVLEREFTGPVRTRPAIWATLSSFDDVRIGTAFQPTSRKYVEVLGRLAPGATRSAAQDNLSAIAIRGRSTSGHASEGGPQGVVLAPATSPIDSEGTDGYVALAAIFGVLALVLALACANTANLLLAGAATRTREIGIRLAMGSTTRRLLRQMLSESVLLGLMAGALGLVCSIWFTPLLHAAVSMPPDLDVQVNLRVLMFGVAVAMVCGVAAGISPARYGARGDVLSTLKSQRSGRQGSAAPSRLRMSFVGFQAAVSMLLLVTAALLARTAIHMTRTSVGFDADKLLTVSVSDGMTKFDEATYLQSSLMAVRALPPVERVSVTQYLPFGRSVWHDELSRDGRSYTLYLNRTDADYFAVAGVRLLRGRSFTADEVADERPVALISDNVARTFLGDVDPIGQPVSRVPSTEVRDMPAIIIGVVDDAMSNRLRTEHFGAIYLPLERQRSSTPGLLVRTASPGAAARAIEDALRRIDPRVPVRTASPAEEMGTYMAQTRMLAWLAGPMAALALVLAMLGLYGVTAFAVSHRAHEMSVRTAIGASTADLLRLLVREGLRPVVIGLALGLFAALVVSRLFSSSLPGISPHDPVSIAAALLTLLASALTAVLVPAKRVARTDPASVLRQI